MRSAFRSEPVEWRSSVTDVVMNIDQAGRDEELRNIHNLSGLVGGNIFFDRCDLALEYGDVAYIVDVIGRIDNVTAF